jgi:cyclopropane-fatty-acyl-phospholipid synthase
VSSLEIGTSGSLIIDSITNIAEHYAPTLRRWRENFEENFDAEGGIRDALGKAHPDITTNPGDAQDEVDIFRRKWLYYLYVNDFEARDDAKLTKSVVCTANLALRSGS